MCCEEASKRLVEAHTAYYRVAGELNNLLTSWVSRPGSLTIGGSEQDELFQRLTREQDELYERYRAAEAAYIEAKKAHHD